MTYSITLVWLLAHVLAFSFSAGAATKVFPPLLSPNITQFAVQSLPNVSFPVPPSWAGQIPIPGTSDNQLFFWLFQAECQNASQNLIIWLNGGPGCSSMTGLTYENGPLRFVARSAIPYPNPESWTKLANVLYIDQPVGTGYSTGSKAASNIAGITSDFVHWLRAFYDHFPALRSKNLYIMGESYAGIYIPYIAHSLLLANRSLLPFLNLRAITLGDPTLGNNAAMTDVVTTTYLRQQSSSVYPIPPPILSAFAAADRTCGFDKVISHLTSYPPKAPVPIPGNPEGLNFLHHLRRRREQEQVKAEAKAKTKTKRQNPCFNGGKAPDTPALINASIHAPCSLGCATYTTAFAYLPSLHGCFDPYNIRYDCQSDLDTSGAAHYLNREDVKKAIHAPNKEFQTCNDTVFETQSQEYVTPPAYAVVPEILARGVKVHVYSGDWDLLLDHWGTELVLQNMTWNNHQGFQSRPNRTFMVNGTKAGEWGYERGLSYHHILRAGHLVPHDQPRVMFEYVRGFVLGGRRGYGGLTP